MRLVLVQYVGCSAMENELNQIRVNKPSNALQYTDSLGCLEPPYSLENKVVTNTSYKSLNASKNLL